MTATRPIALALALLLGAGAAATVERQAPSPSVRATAFQAHVASDPDGAAAAPDPLWVRIHHMSLLDKVRQLIVPSFSGTRVPTSLVQRMHPGALIYFGGNLTSQAQTRTLSAGIQHAALGHSLPLLLMTDQEGGTVTRIPGTEGTPGGIDFHGNAAWAHNTAVRTGRLMSRLEVNTNLAPDADVNTAGPGGVIGDRSFGSTPGVVSRLTNAQVCGYHSGGVATTVKHFPGHGSTDTDSHLRTAVIRESVAKWTATDLPPFQSAIAHGVDMILVGHLAFPAMDPSGRPATISRKLNFGLLRSRLHFQGVVITDALNMGGITSWGTPGEIAVDTIKAGSDMLLMPPQPVVAVQAIAAAVRQGVIVQGRLDMSVYRVLKLKQTLGLLRPAKALAQC
jgi:beta-N-acetylhexosaminidase